MPPAAAAGNPSNGFGSVAGAVLGSCDCGSDLAAETDEESLVEDDFASPWETFDSVSDLDARLAAFSEALLDDLDRILAEEAQDSCGGGGGPALPGTTKGDLVTRDSTSLVRLAVGSDQQVLTADSAQAKGIRWAAAPEGFYGDGSDGSATYSTSVSMTRDRYFNDLTIQSGGSLDPRGFVIYVKGKLTISSGGKIQSDGGVGGNGASGTGGAAGAAGGGTTRTPCLGLGRAGGRGQDGGGAGSTAGTGQSGGASSAFPDLRSLVRGGCGGGGGGGYGSAPANGGQGQSGYGAAGGTGDSASGTGSSNLGGGGGGGGGGVVLIFAKEIDNAGTISADGGAGGAGQTDLGTGDTSGGGGGGGGGIVVLFYTTATGSGVGSLSAAGGGGGTGGSAGTTTSYQVSV